MSVLIFLIINGFLLCHVRGERSRDYRFRAHGAPCGFYLSLRLLGGETKFLKLLNFDSTPVKDSLIIGGGRSSYYLAKILLNMGIRVKIVEIDPLRCEQLSVLLPNAIIINGDGTDEKLLKEAGIETVESFVSLTNIDETNIFLTIHAKQISNAKVITKIKRMNFKSIINGMDLALP